MIPVRVKLSLNIRKGPGRSFDVMGIAPASGKIIQMDGVKDEGENWKGISKWYFKLNDKNEKQWYWAGRTEEVGDEQEAGLLPLPSDNKVEPVNFNTYFIENVGVKNQAVVISNTRVDFADVKNNIDYSFLLNIDDGLKQTKGEGVTVAIMDHPISKNMRFKKEVIRPFDLGEPIDAHGDMIAGIIAGNSIIRGIAPNVTLVNLPIRDSNGSLQIDRDISRIVDFLNSLKPPLILNVSQSFSFSDKLSDSFKKIRNAIVVASSGLDNDITDLGEGNLNFPANLESVISVGCLSKEFAMNPVNKAVNFAFPCFNYLSYSNAENKLQRMKDTSSFSVAVMTGIIALLASGGKINNDIDNIREVISSLSLPYNDLNNYNYLNSLRLLK